MSPLPVVLFDGFCAKCTRWARWIERRDPTQRLALVAQDSVEGDGLLSSRPVHLQSVDSVFVVQDDRWHARSSAVCRILFKLGLHWSIVGGLLWLIPKPLRDLGYDIFARRRQRVPPSDS